MRKISSFNYIKLYVLLLLERKIPKQVFHISQSVQKLRNVKFHKPYVHIPINLIFITKTFDQFQKIINLVLYLIKLNPNNIFYLINKNSKLVSIKIETKFLKENKKSHFIRYFSKHIKYIKLYGYLLTI